MNIKDNIFLQHEIKSVLLCFGMVGDIVDNAARGIICVLRRLLGGDRVYFPVYLTADRNARIRAAFNGCNRDEVRKQFGIAKTTFYRVIGEKV